MPVSRIAQRMAGTALSGGSSAPAVRNRPIEQHQHKEFARPFGSFALQAEARRNIGSGRNACVSFEDPWTDWRTRTPPRNLEKSMVSVGISKTNARSWNYPELLELL